MSNGTLQARPLYYGLFMFSELVANRSVRKDPLPLLLIPLK